MKHTISVLVENQSGVLARIAGLFSARGFNIDSLSVGETEDPTISRMTITLDGDDRILEQVTKQLHRVVDVIKVIDLTRKEFIDRELVLVKVNVNKSRRPEIIPIIESCGAKIAAAEASSLTVEAVGDRQKIRTLLEMLRPYGIREVSRTGRIAVSR